MQTKKKKGTKTLRTMTLDEFVAEQERELARSDLKWLAVIGAILGLFGISLFYW